MKSNEIIASSFFTQFVFLPTFNPPPRLKNTWMTSTVYFTRAKLVWPRGCLDHMLSQPRWQIWMMGLFSGKYRCCERCFSHIIWQIRVIFLKLDTSAIRKYFVYITNVDFATATVDVHFRNISQNLHFRWSVRISINSIQQDDSVFTYLLVTFFEERETKSWGTHECLRFRQPNS